MVDETTGEGNAGCATEPRPTMAQLLQPWRERSPELTRWAWDRMVVRTDVWGGYRPLADRGKKKTNQKGEEFELGTTCTHPWKSKRGKAALTPGVLEQHFRARYPEHVVGIHTTSPDNVCKYGTVEIDVHGDGGNDPAITLAAAVGWYDELRDRGFRPLLWDSNGAGGFHLDVFFADPAPSANLFWYLRELVADYAQYGLTAPPETFPKQPRVAAPGQRGEYGNWCRVVGRHHTRNHVATVYDGCGGWLAGAEAVAAVLATPAAPAEFIPADAETTGRVLAYMRKMPNRGEGQGRDDVAYNLLAWLVRDMKLPDDVALRWAGEWDRGNTPPKGPDRLREILANVHEYGRKEYGAGVNGTSPPGRPPGDGSAGQTQGQTHARDPLPLIYYSDVTPVLEVNDFTEGVFTDGTMSVVYGESGCGKTFFSLDHALHVAAGMPWRGRGVEKRGVLYLALEGGHGIRNRVAAFKATHGPDAPALAIVPVQCNLLDPNADTVLVIEAATRAAERLSLPVGLVVIDTLSRAIFGGNENSPDDMGALVSNLDRIRQALPSHVQAIHHSGKDVAKGARGHSLLRAATDTEIEVSRDPSGEVSVARVTKQRDLPCEGEFAFRLESVHLGTDRRGKPVASCVVVPEDDLPKGRRNLPTDAKVALALLTELIADKGKTGECGVPHGTRCVTFDDWRSEFYQRGNKAGDKQDTKRRAFGRAKDRLTEDRAVFVNEPFVWLGN